MTTTVLFIEHLITGLQSFIWLSLLTFSITGYNWFRFDLFKGFELFISFIALAIIYPIGIFVDNIADDLFKKWSKKIRDKIMSKEKVEYESLTVMKILYHSNDEFLKNYLGYIRTRIRISRSTALNFLIITILSVLFTIIRLNNLRATQFLELIIIETFIGVLIVIISIISWYRITQVFAKQIAYAYKMIKESNNV